MVCIGLNTDVSEKVVVFRHHKSLANFHFPALSIKADDMDSLVKDLMLNKTKTLINFSACALDNGAWNLLERALLQDSPNKDSISSFQPTSDASGKRLQSFLHNLRLKPGIKNIHFSSYLDADEEKSAASC